MVQVKILTTSVYRFKRVFASIIGISYNVRVKRFFFFWNFTIKKLLYYKDVVEQKTHNVIVRLEQRQRFVITALDDV